ncbi:MAG: M20 family metallopeptidase [Chloroflexota bacterium]
MRDQAEKIKDEIIRLRRDIHQHPELGFEEVRTARLVADTLTEIGGIEIKTGVGLTGVLGQIGTGEGPTIGIRADMDALPLDEQVDKPFKSVNAGVMHACGHDAHTAMLLGAAHLLRQSFAENQDKWQGNVRFLFQPCEEKFDADGVSGATAMIADAAMEDVDYVISVHVGSTKEAGICYFWDGPTLAAPDTFEGKIFATGGHGAFPHRGTDPIFMLNTVLGNLFAIRSRYINPLDSSVISVGAIHTGTAPNIIPAEIYLNGTIRSHKTEIRERLWAEIERAFSLVEGMGGRYELDIIRGYPPLINSSKVNQWMKSAALDLYGEDQVVDEPMGMAGEDFAYMANKAPGAMFSLGAMIEGGGGHHTPLFDIDEEVLPIGSAVLAETARRFVMGEIS